MLLRSLNTTMVCMGKLCVFYYSSSQDSGVIFVLLPFGFAFSFQLFPKAYGDFTFLLGVLLGAFWPFAGGSSAHLLLSGFLFGCWYERYLISTVLGEIGI